MGKPQLRKSVVVMTMVSMILAMLSIGVFTTPALAQDATISGTVTCETTTLPIEFCIVRVYPAEWECAHTEPPELGSAVTDGLGDYTVVIIDAEGYEDFKVEFSPPDDKVHLLEWWDSPVDARITEWTDATWLHVAVGGTALGIDAQLERTGYITGTVTCELGPAIEGCTVTVYRKTGEDEYIVAGSGVTDASGDYLVGMLQAGDYLAQFSIDDTEHLGQWYDEKVEIDADEFSVVYHQETPNIDAALWVGGLIRGHVTMECGGADVLNCFVEVLDADTGMLVLSKYTDAFGNYEISPLEGGDYKVSFIPDPMKAPQWYDGAVSLDEATVISLPRGTIANNIDAELTWDELNRYAVTPANFDDIGPMVNSLGVLTESIAIDSGGTSADADLSNTCLLPKFDGVFVNCTACDQFDPPGIVGAIQDYVQHGGNLFLSDCSGYKLITDAFPGKITFPAVYPGQGLEQTVDAEVLDSELSDAIGSEPEMVFDQNGFIVVTGVTGDVDVYITATVETDALGTITDMPVYMSFPYGDGEVWFTTFHSSAQSEAVGGGILRFFLGRTMPPPVITSIKPNSGPVGTEVTIDGRHFGVNRVPENEVTFGGQEAYESDYIFWSDDQLIVKVPEGAKTGDVTVSTLAGVSNSLKFTVTGGPGPTPPGPSETWYLAEGSTGANASGAFETWVLVQNPGDEDATVNLTYMTDGGIVPGPGLNLKANSRVSLNVADTVPDTWSVSTKVTADKPIIAERSVYWNTPGVSRQAAHDSIGVNDPATTWYLAEGSTGSNELGAFETWVLVQNPGDEEAAVSLTYMTEGGIVPGPDLILKGNSRTSLNVADTVPETWSVSTKVTSDKPVIAERSIYWNTPSVYRQAAHDSIGTNEPDTIWYLAEGSTGNNETGAFETWVLVQNPGEEDTKIYLTYMTDDGNVPGPELILKANSRTSLNVADTVPDTWSVSTRVTADKAVIAERSVYWSTPSVSRQAAHDSIGVAGE